VVNPRTLFEEMDLLAGHGVTFDRLFISERAHVIMPYHVLLDDLEERARGARLIGTTKRGVGPAYADKVARHGLQVGDLLDSDYFRQRAGECIAETNRLLAGVYGEPPLDVTAIVETYLAYGRRLAPHVVDSLALTDAALRRDEVVLLEGQLGVLRDLDWGWYPWVTSSNPLPGGACAGAGIPPWRFTRVLGVVKAFSTSVGTGPMPTELHGSEAEFLREGGPEEGWEYGATTGRPRRCGWLDLVAVRHAATVAGFTGLAVTKLDVLDPLSRIRVCVAYRDPTTGREYRTLPPTRVTERVTPVYEEWPGWQKPTGSIRAYGDLPRRAQAYLQHIGHVVGVPVEIVTVGPARDQTIDMR
jgi:adenylosuccinate synthase